MLTNRDKQYLRAVFLLQGSTRPVGPMELAVKMGVSKVCAFQKMRRLEALGYGEYHLRKGLKLNDLGVLIIEQDIKNHHILEKFLEDTLKMTSREACDQSSHIGPFISEKLINNIANKIGTKSNCNCGNCLETPKNYSELEQCHWLKKSI
jgi:Mn-dependent DtxR family transcriptional regulator